MAACSISGPATVPAISDAIGDSLPGAQGATLKDQRAIDLTVARACGAEIYAPALCEKHSEASAARIRALGIPAAAGS